MANHIQLMMYEGFLAADPDSRFMDDGKQVTNFRFGSTRQYTKKNGDVAKETTWFKAVAWGKLAEIIAKYCEKGSHVIVTGALRPAENGSPAVYELKAGGFGSSYELTVREIRILKGKDGAVAGESHVSDEVAEDDVPF